MTRQAGTRSTRMGTLMATAGILLLSGDLSPVGAAGPPRAADEASQRAMSYCSQLRQDPQLAPLRGKVPFHGRNASFRHTTIEMKAGPAEKKALVVLAENWRKCHEAHRANFRRFGGWRHNLAGLDEHMYQTENLILAAYKGEISLGTLNRLRKESSWRYERRKADALARRQAAHRRAMARRRRSEEEFQRRLAEQRRRQEERARRERERNRTVTCHWYGNTRTCRSY